MSWVVRARLLVLGLLVVAAVGLGFFYGFVRAFIAVALGAAIVWVGGRYLQSVVNAPADPEVADVAKYELRYVCTMCGLELKVEKAARDKAPTHCMEPMVLVTGHGPETPPGK
jgi:hypothetical protein